MYHTHMIVLGDCLEGCSHSSLSRLTFVGSKSDLSIGIEMIIDGRNTIISHLIDLSCKLKKIEVFPSIDLPLERWVLT